MAWSYCGESNSANVLAEIPLAEIPLAEIPLAEVGHTPIAS